MAEQLITLRAMKKKEPKMLTTKEVAERIGAAPISVRIWASEGRFPGARKETHPRGDYWLIPETDLIGFVNPGRGRPPKDTSKKKGKGWAALIATIQRPEMEPSCERSALMPRRRDEISLQKYVRRLGFIAQYVGILSNVGPNVEPKKKKPLSSGSNFFICNRRVRIWTADPYRVKKESRMMGSVTEYWQVLCSPLTAKDLLNPQ